MTHADPGIDERHRDVGAARLFPRALNDVEVYVILVNYLVDLSAIDEALDAHIRWLDEQYDAGLFLASGRRKPRTGGIIFAVGDRAAIDAAVARDPFAERSLAHHEVIEFHPSRLGGPLDADSIRDVVR